MGVSLGPTLTELIPVVQLRCRSSGLFCALLNSYCVCYCVLLLEEKVSQITERKACPQCLGIFFCLWLVVMLLDL